MRARSSIREQLLDWWCGDLFEAPRIAIAGRQDLFLSWESRGSRLLLPDEYNSIPGGACGMCSRIESSPRVFFVPRHGGPPISTWISAGVRDQGTKYGINPVSFDPDRAWGPLGRIVPRTWVPWFLVAKFCSTHGDQPAFSWASAACTWVSWFVDDVVLDSHNAHMGFMLQKSTNSHMVFMPPRGEY